MVNVAAPGRDPLALRLLSNLGSFVAMIVVLAVVGLAIVKVSGASEQSDSSSPLIDSRCRPVIGSLREGHTNIRERNVSDDPDNRKREYPQFWETLFIVALTIGVLAGADRVFGRRFLKLRS